MMNSKLFSISVILLLTLFNGISRFSKSQTYQRITINEIFQQSGKEFYKNQCGFCHTKEELIAPDMTKIKATYLKKYTTKDAFVKAVSAFVKNPNKKNAIYRDGIENFTDMPKMPFKDAQIKSVAEYIYSATSL